jgi:hypothetical protein
MKTTRTIMVLLTVINHNLFLLLSIILPVSILKFAAVSSFVLYSDDIVYHHRRIQKQLPVPVHTRYHHSVVQQDEQTTGSRCCEGKHAIDSVQRRQFLSFMRLVGLFGTCTVTLPINSKVANALVKGNAPPPSSSSSSSSSTIKSIEKLKCTNVEDCQEMAERRDEQLRILQQEQDMKDNNIIMTTKLGTRYRDIGTTTTSSSSTSSSTENDKKGTLTVQDGDTVTMYYKVLKLGKRSYDGLSGEGTVIFSRGYGYEDDEIVPKQKSFATKIGSNNNIIALNDGIIGLTKNCIRRIQVLPERGWRKPDLFCDGGPGGKSIGGTIKTDYIVVPTATMVETETCFDTTKLPFPQQSYAEQRRMAQRFDQSLILEVEVIDIVKPS